jgi:hypothetical protein
LAGKRWSFTDGSHPAQILGRGWAVPSDGGLWNDGTSATLRLGEVGCSGVPAMCSVEGQTFSHRQRVQVFVGTTQLAEFILPQGVERGLAIPPDMLAPGQSLRLEFPDADIPYNVGFNDDRRTLALRLTGLEWRPVETPPRKAPRLFGTFVVRSTPGILRIWGRGKAPEARFRLNGAQFFSCRVSSDEAWSAWLVVSPEQARASRLRLDICQTAGAEIDVAGVDQFAVEGASAGEVPILLHPVHSYYDGDVREIVETPAASFIERVERRLYALISSRAAAPLPSLPAEPSPAPSPDLPPLTGQPVAAAQASYNAAARLLRVHVTVSAAVDEVRVLGDNGAEMARVLPQDLKAEAALICPPDTLPHSLIIESYGAAGLIDEQAIPHGNIQPIMAEMAAIALTASEIIGAFWIRSKADGDWQIICNEAPLGQARADASLVLEDIAVRAVPFRVPLPDRDIRPAHGDLPGDGIFITPSNRTSQIPMQRPLTLSRIQLKGPRRPAPELAALCDKHRGQTAWIIGNGPSVRLDDLAAIPAGDVVFAFNRFYLSYPDHPLREDYVVSADAQMVDDFGQEVIDHSGGLPLFCLPDEALPHLKGRFVALTPGNSHLPVFSTDPAHFVSVGGSSVFVALQMAWYMGLRDVRLYGMDYSFTTILDHDPRYVGLVAVNDGNHFIENYRGDRPWYPPAWGDIATGFLNARIAFELNGGRIVNATRGGRLETFPRRDFDALVAGD